MVRVTREETLSSTHSQCRLCESGDVEDIDHLLFSCPAHAKHRQRTITVSESVMARAGVGPLGVLPVRERADILLGKSTGVVAAVADSCINNSVTRFLKKAGRGHKQLTTVLNSTFGRDDTVWTLRAQWRRAA